jgi:hypothetical protein
LSRSREACIQEEKMATNGNVNGRFIVGADIGGTFTDAVAIDPISGEARVGKALTRPGQEEDGALDAIDAGR